MFQDGSALLAAGVGVPFCVDQESRCVDGGDGQNKNEATRRAVSECRAMTCNPECDDSSSQLDYRTLVLERERKCAELSNDNGLVVDIICSQAAL